MKEDLKLIENFINNNLSEEEVILINQRLDSEEEFRQLYLNHLLDNRLIGKALQADIDTEVRVTSKKNRRQTVLLTILSAAAAFAIAFTLLKPVKTASFTKLGSNSQLIRSGKAVNFDLDTDIRVGDLIKAGSDELFFEYKDGTSIVMKPGSEIEVTGSSDHKKLYLSKGEILANVNPQPKERKMEIKTSTSKAYILGTRFTIEAEKAKSNLKVLKGKVHFHNNTGSEDFVVGGEYALAKGDAPVISRASYISKDKIRSDEAKYLKWRAFSKKFIEDPDMLAYYDFEDVSEKQNKVLHNKALSTQGMGLDGEIITTLPMDGRWVQKGALYFSEYGYVNFNNSKAYNIKNSITVFAWMRIKKFYRGWQTIIAKGDHTWRLARNRQHNYLEFCCNGIEPQHVLIGKKNVNDGEWHLIVGTYNQEEICLYVDGELDHKLKAKGKINTDTYPVHIGANSRHKGRDFEGWMDELGIMKRALTHEEIREMFRLGKP